MWTRKKSGPLRNMNIGSLLALDIFRPCISSLRCKDETRASRSSSRLCARCATEAGGTEKSPLRVSVTRYSSCDRSCSEIGLFHAGRRKDEPDTDKETKRRRWSVVVAAASGVLAALPAPAFAMHISEGILPAPWALLWYALAIPFVAWGLRDLKRRSEEIPYFKPLIGLVGAAVFLISCMPVPVPTAGTCSHPAGTGLAAILIGPGLTVVVASIALTLQALFLAHGGLTTLGANIVAMGVAGAYVGYGVYRIVRHLGLPWAMAAFLAGLLSDWATYAMTSVELAAALHGGGSFWEMVSLILIAFVPTQLPLGIFEGILCVGALKFVRSRKPELLDMASAGGAA